MATSKFFYIKRRDLDKLHQLFESKDPELKMVLSEYGNYSDVAAYAPKYDTVVFTSTKSALIKKRL